jgi:hypothetical protein
MPTYREVAEHYNANIEHLSRLWAASNVHMEWTEDGKQRTERGEGSLYIVMPDHIALTVGKVGQLGLVAGCDDKRYWYFDLRDEGVVYVGTQAAAARRAATGKADENPLGLPIRPLDLPELLGIAPLGPPDAYRNIPGMTVVSVGWDGKEGSLVVAFWSPVPPGPGRVLRLDPKTYLPRRITLFSERGHMTAESTLDKPMRVETRGLPPGAWPWISTFVSATMT